MGLVDRRHDNGRLCCIELETPHDVQRKPRVISLKDKNCRPDMVGRIVLDRLTVSHSGSNHSDRYLSLRQPRICVLRNADFALSSQDTGTVESGARHYSAASRFGLVLVLRGGGLFCAVT